MILAASVALHGLLFIALFPPAPRTSNEARPHAEAELLIAPKATPGPALPAAAPLRATSARPRPKRVTSAQSAISEIAVETGPIAGPTQSASRAIELAGALGPAVPDSSAAVSDPVPPAAVPAPDYRRIASDCSRRIESVLRYPALARRGRIEGTATVRFLVDGSGTPRRPDLVSSSGHRLLDEEALAAVVRAAPFPSCDRPLVVPVVFALKR